MKAFVSTWLFIVLLIVGGGCAMQLLLFKDASHTVAQALLHTSWLWLVYIYTGLSLGERVLRLMRRVWGEEALW